MEQEFLTNAKPSPPEGKPIYRYLTGPDDSSFCERVSAELAKGWVLYGNPTMTFNGQRVIVGQVIVWPEGVKHHVSDLHHRWAFSTHENVPD